MSWLLVAFASTRWAYYNAGVRFDWDGLDWFWQFIDVALLRSELAKSLFYLHSQPPAFDLFLGIIVKLFPGAEGEALHVVYLALGFSLHACTYALMRRLQVPVWVAFVCTVTSMASPAAILYENWLFYSHPLAAMLSASAVLLHRFLIAGLKRDALAFFSLVMLVALTQSLFHISWCVLTLGVVLLYVPPTWRVRSLACACLPMTIVLAVDMKNAIVFGQFGTSTWIGMNAAKVTIDRMDPGIRDELIRQGVLSPLARIPPFSWVGSYPREFRDVPTLGVAVLDRREKDNDRSGYRRRNYNHYAYIAIARQYMKDSIGALRAAPSVFLESLRLGLAVFALPASDYWFLDGNRQRVRAIDRAYNVFVYGTFRAWSAQERPRGGLLDPEYLKRHRSYLWMALIPLGVAWSVLVGVMQLRRRRDTPGVLDLHGAAHAGTMVYLALTVSFVSVVGNLLELGENNRFRYDVDALILTMAVATATMAVRTALARPTRSRSQPASGDEILLR